MRTFTLLLLLIVTASSTALLFRDVSPTEPKPTPGPPTIEQVQALSALVTTRVEVADVQETEIRGYTGEIKGVLLVRGDVLLTVNLSNARFESVDRRHRTAALVLPQPEACSPRLDHRKTRLFAIRDDGLWLLTPGKSAETALVNRAYRQAQRMLGEVGAQPNHVGAARGQAEKVLGCFFEAIGWRVKILWAGR